MLGDESNDDRTQSFVALTAGTTVSHYKIIEKIGAGGMGEVYLAEDTQLNRKVALKFLPWHLCQDAECRARFKREAQASAKLSHANIVHLYEVSEYQGLPFFSMEMIEGRTLRQTIKEGQLPLRDLLSFAIQVCAGLTEAHESGVIHRDIKPGNILVDKKERAKLVDFGLASIVSESKLTKTGSTLGTVSYMSPEQVRGEKLDHRSDIFSLGVVLYELLTGRQPFARDNDGAITHAIVNDTPEPLARYKSDLPDGLQLIVSKALSKDRETRYQHADDMSADLKRELDDLSHPRAASLAPASVMAQGKRWLVAALSIAVVAAAVATVVTLTRQRSVRLVTERTQLTFVGDAVVPALSPDGEYLAYVRTGTQNGLRALMVQDLAGGAPIKVFEDDLIFGASWSPDGSELLFSAWNDSTPGIVVVPRMGGSSRRYSIFSPRATWSPDGTQFATVGAGGRVYFIDKKSGDTISIACDTTVDAVDWSPNGNLFALSLVTDSGWSLATSDIKGSKINRILDTIPAISPKWSRKGDAIYFMEDRGENPPNFFKIYVDPRTGERKSDPILLISSLLGGQYAYSVSADGRRMVFRQRVESSNLWLAQLDTTGTGQLKTRQLTSGTAELWEPSISPDGGRVAFAKRVRDEVHLFTMSLEGGTPTQITHTNPSNRLPAWSPDGKTIAYAVWDNENNPVAVIDADGGVPHLFQETSYTNYIAWYPGEQILYSSWDNYELLNPENGALEQLMEEDINGYVSDACYSTDGHAVAFLASEYEGEWHIRKKTRRRLVIYLLDGHTKIHSFPAVGVTDCIGWTADGKWVYLTWPDSAGTSVKRLRVADGVVEPVVSFPWTNVWDVAMGPNRSTFVCVRGNQQSDIWLVEGFDPDVK